MNDKDIQIITQMYNGYHLQPNELQRARELMHKLNLYLKQQKG
jgi:hypothetical protein